MKISDIIEVMEKFKDKHGDLEVISGKVGIEYIHSWNDEIPVEAFQILNIDIEKVQVEKLNNKIIRLVTEEESYTTSDYPTQHYSKSDFSEVLLINGIKENKDKEG